MKSFIRVLPLILTVIALGALAPTPASAQQAKPRSQPIEIKPLVGSAAITSAVSSVAFSPDGARVLSGGEDKTVKLWNAATGQLVRTFEGHAKKVASVAFSPDGARVLTGSWDKTVKLWDAATGRLLLTFKLDGSVTSVAFSPDGARVLSGGHVLERSMGFIYAYMLFWWANPEIKLWDASSGQLLRTWKEGLGSNESVHAVAFSPDGTRVLSASHDWTGVNHILSKEHRPTVKLWDATTGQLLLTFAGHSDRVTSAAFSPDGSRVLSGGWDETVKLWDAATGQVLRTFEGYLKEVNWPGAADGDLAMSGKLDKAVAFSPDGIRVLAASQDKTMKWRDADKTMKLWDAATGRLVRTFEGHTGDVNSLSISPDGTRVLSGSEDHTVKLWELKTGELLATLVAGGGEWIAFTPEGFFDASKDGPKLVSFVRGFKVLGMDHVSKTLHQPDLVQEKIAGDPNGKVKAAVAKIAFD